VPDTDPKPAQVRGQTAKAHSATADAELAETIEQTARLWRKHHMSYDQSKYVVAQVRKSLQLCAPKTRRRTVDRMDRNEVEKLVEAGYQRASK
jgi:integrase/recombinase XerD